MILRCPYVVRINIQHQNHFDVSMLSSYEVALLDFVIFHIGRLFLYLVRWKYYRIKDAQLQNPKVAWVFPILDFITIN